MFGLTVLRRCRRLLETCETLQRENDELRAMLKAADERCQTLEAKASNAEEAEENWRSAANKAAAKLAGIRRIADGYPVPAGEVMS